MILINRHTGKEATENEIKLALQRARHIFRNPYASPEQLDWAIKIIDGANEMKDVDENHRRRITCPG